MTMSALRPRLRLLLRYILGGIVPNIILLGIVNNQSAIQNSSKRLFPGSVEEIRQAILNQSDTKRVEATTTTTTTTTEETLSFSTESPSTNKFDDKLEATTRLLYKDSSDLSYWLKQPPPKLYIYDTFPDDIANAKNVSTCVMDSYKRWFLDRNYNHTNCEWFPKVCDDKYPPDRNDSVQRVFMAKRMNYNNDVAFLHWFQTKYPYRTSDPAQADFFLVPYAHWSHCVCARCFWTRASRCFSSWEDYIQPNITSRLPYWNQQTTNRHLFVFGADYQMIEERFRNAVSFSLSLGEVSSCTGKADVPCGDMVVPYLSTQRNDQPSFLASLSEEWWTTRPRTFALGAILGSPGRLTWRTKFVQNYTELLGDSIGGMPYNVTDLGHSRIPLKQDQVSDVYSESVFCIILPGDGCAQKRFFDVMMNGCIPLVPYLKTSSEPDSPTFHPSGGICAIRTTYPFIKGAFVHDANAGLDYESLVLRWDATCGFDCLKDTLEEALNDTERIYRIRRNIREVVTLFSYELENDGDNDNGDSGDGNDYEEDGTTIPDAFMATTVSIRHYLRHLPNDTRVG